MEKAADGDEEYVATFEETLQRFVGLSSEEIWELQRILVRRVRCKISESLSPEGRTAMKQVKQEMHDRQVELQKMGVSSATLVTELFDLGSKQEADNRQNGEVMDIILIAADDTDKSANVNNQSADEIDKVLNENKTDRPKSVADTKTEIVEKKNVKEADDTETGAEDKEKTDEGVVERAQSRDSARETEDKTETPVAPGEEGDASKETGVTSPCVSESDDTVKDQNGSIEGNGDVPKEHESSGEDKQVEDNKDTTNSSENKSAPEQTESATKTETENTGTST